MARAATRARPTAPRPGRTTRADDAPQWAPVQYHPGDESVSCSYYDVVRDPEFGGFIPAIARETYGPGAPRYLLDLLRYRQDDASDSATIPLRVRDLLHLAHALPRLIHEAKRRGVLPGDPDACAPLPRELRGRAGARTAAVRWRRVRATRRGVA